jgi:hypothetical protein
MAWDKICPLNSDNLTSSSTPIHQMTAANRIILDYKRHSGAVARYFDVVVCSCWSMVTYFVGIMQLTSSALWLFSRPQRPTC